MAYVSKEKKQILVEKVKAVLPKDWKVTFSVSHYSTFIVRVKQSPFDFSEFFPESHKLKEDYEGVVYDEINEYHYERTIKNPELISIIAKIIEAMNFDNHNNSDSMSDYFDVGHYTTLSIGKYDKSYVKGA